jgi:hypothetical protein
MSGGTEVGTRDQKSRPTHTLIRLIDSTVDKKIIRSNDHVQGSTELCRYRVFLVLLVILKSFATPFPFFCSFEKPSKLLERE